MRRAWLDETLRTRGTLRRSTSARPCRPCKDENWRYTSLRGIDFDAFRAARGDARPARTPTVLGDLETAGELVQRGQDVVHVRLDDDAARAQGVVLSSLDDAVETHAELVDRHLGTRARPARPLHRRELGDLERRRVRVRAAGRRGRAAAARSSSRTPRRARARSGARCVVVEAGRAADAARGARPRRARATSTASLELVLGDGAEVDLRADAGAPPRDRTTSARQRAEIARDATLRLVLARPRRQARQGAPWSRASAARARPCASTGLYALDERQHLDLDTSQEHAAPNATSDLAYKGALRGHARSVWRGIIKVDEGAQGTDAFQENRNLLLSRPRARRLDPRPPDPRQRRALHARGDGRPGRLASCSSSSWRAGFARARPSR